MNKFICTRRQRLRLLSELVTGVSVRIRTWYFAGMRKYPVASRISKQSHVCLDYTVIYETRSKIWYIDYSVVPFAFCTEYLRFEGINVEVDA